jgi:hypothetical protein
MSGKEDNRRTTAYFSFYGPQYARIDSELAAEIKREVFAEDIGQESRRSAHEQTEAADLLGLPLRVASSMWPAAPAALR